MKIAIDKNGHLLIQRAGQLKPQYCPFSAGGDRCGGWCPLFEEETFQDEDSKGFLLKLCHYKIYVLKEEDFKDERGGV